MLQGLSAARSFKLKLESQSSLSLTMRFPTHLHSHLVPKPCSQMMGLKQVKLMSQWLVMTSFLDKGVHVLRPPKRIHLNNDPNGHGLRRLMTRILPKSGDIQKNILVVLRILWERKREGLRRFV